MSPSVLEYLNENSLLLLLYSASLIVVFGFYKLHSKQWQSKVLLLQEMLDYKQGLLDITYWATGEMILESRLDSGSALCLNPNPDIELEEGVPHFLSQSFIERVHSDDRPFARSQYEKILNSRDNTYELHYRLTKSTGVQWIVEKGTVLERDPQGKAKRLISSLRDVTSFKREQDRLAQLANEFERRLKLAEAAQLSD